MTAPSSTATGDQPLVARLIHLAVLTFDGADAASFLHNQLSTDVESMPVGAAGWTSYNSPKGRVLANLLLWRRAQDAFVGFVAADLAESLRKRLSMFVLRAKVAIADRTAGWQLLGVAGPGADAAVHVAFATAPEPGHGAALADADVVATPDGRFLVVTDDGAKVRARLPATEMPATHWNWLGVRAGVPIVTSATQDQFVAQTLNLDLIGGINFRKGCYPGQEIIARMQYLGRLKERLFAFHVDAPPPAPGTRIQSGETAAGTVVNAAEAANGGSDLLAVANWMAVEAGGLRLGDADGPALSPLVLPYAVPAPTAPNRVKL
jgi:folate-binding protein YgfZ